MLLILGKTGIASAWPEPVRSAAVSAVWEGKKSSRDLEVPALVKLLRAMITNLELLELLVQQEEKKVNKLKITIIINNTRSQLCICVQCSEGLGY